MKMRTLGIFITSAVLTAVFVGFFNTKATAQSMPQTSKQFPEAGKLALLTPPEAPQEALEAEPRYTEDWLEIPSINVNARVLTMGLEPSGKMAVPNNYTEVGLYQYGARPGMKGTAVMGAHVDNGGAIPGVFKSLSKVKEGDKVYFYTADGERLTYTIVKTKVYAYNEKNTQEVFDQTTSKKRIALITCHGRWLPFENTYNQRFVAFAELD